MLEPPLDLTDPPGLLERQGLHVMRRRAWLWCRAHPIEAMALPSWMLGDPRAWSGDPPPLPAATI